MRHAIFSRTSIGATAIVLSLCCPLPSIAESPTGKLPTSPSVASPNIEQSLSTIIQQLVIDSVPRQFSDDKKWDKQTKVVNGLSIKSDGDGLKIRKHTHEVNDGLWTEYRGELVDPNKELQIRVENLHSSGPGQSSLQLFLAARLHGKARLEQWKDGVRLFSIASDADCKIEARIDIDVRWHWQPGTLFGDVAVEPKVTGADLRLLEFDLKKVGPLQGWAARELGDGLKHTVAKQLHREEPKLVEKLNAAIQKKQGKLTFSPDAAVATGVLKLESLLHLNDAVATSSPQPQADDHTNPKR